MERTKRLTKLVIKFLSNLAVLNVTPPHRGLLSTAVADYCDWHRLAAK
jgi:hypothetical protein